MVNKSQKVYHFAMETLRSAAALLIIFKVNVRPVLSLPFAKHSDLGGGSVLSLPEFQSKIWKDLKKIT